MKAAAGGIISLRKNLTQITEGAVAGRVENLKPWKPGQSGNPSGRPKRRLIDEALEELLLRNDSELALAIAKKLLARAIPTRHL